MTRPSEEQIAHLARAGVTVEWEKIGRAKLEHRITAADIAHNPPAFEQLVIAWMGQVMRAAVSLLDVPELNSNGVTMRIYAAGEDVVIAAQVWT